MSKQESANTFPKSVRCHVSRPRYRRGRSAALLFVAAVAASAVLLGGVEYARAGEYTVYTTNVAARSMRVDTGDNYCSLAEAVASANAGEPINDDCPDGFPGSFQTINLVEAPGLPFSSNPYKITSLTINSPERSVFLTSIGGSRGKIDVIDSTPATYSGFIINSGTQMTFYFVDLTYTGTAGKRLVENFGAMDAYAATFSKGNVTSHQQGRGGAILNDGGLIFGLGSDVLFSNNKAKRGGAIYNNGGRILNLYATISDNSATLAGGGIYNQSTALDTSGGPSGKIFAIASTITRNSAKAGGGVFNRGEFDMTGGSMTFNTVSGTGSGETCTSGQLCDGAGGGVVNTAGSPSLIAILRTRGGATISNNTASGFGGATYTTAVANLIGVTIAGNRARSGAAIYAVLQGASYYCQVGSSSGIAAINDNDVTFPGGTRHSIVDGIVLPGDEQNRKCRFDNASATENSRPYCKPDMLHPSSGPCPQSLP